MTRDEAIKAMRKGREVKHGVLYYRIFNGHMQWKNNTPVWHDICNADILISSDYDEGWEVVKTKTKKTYYQPIEMFEGSPGQTWHLFETLKDAEASVACRAYTPGNVQIISFDLEVEE